MSDDARPCRWAQVIGQWGTVYAPFAFGAVGLTVHLLGIRATVAIGQTALPIGMAIMFSGLAVALVTWVALGAILGVQDLFRSSGGSRDENDA